MSKYDKAFKDEAIRLALTTPQPLSKTARDLQIKEATLYSWVSQAKAKSPTIKDESGSQTNVLEELNRLRKENMRLREERDILKKATAFFAKHSK